MHIIMKPILPQKLKQKEMRFALLNAMRKYGTHVKKEFGKTTATWTHKPKWNVTVSLAKNVVRLFVWTEDTRYRWIDRGTGKHGPRGMPYPIVAGYYTGKSDKIVLAFPSVSTPKTKPGSLKSGAGGSGPVDTFTPNVLHPGIKPRDFTGQMKVQEEPKYRKAMIQAMRDAAAKSGNAL